jgi:hypothetical protein
MAIVPERAHHSSSGVLGRRDLETSLAQVGEDATGRASISLRMRLGQSRWAAAVMVWIGM